MKNIIIDGYNITKQNLRGLTHEQFIELIKYQNFRCALSGKKFEYKEDLQKFIDVTGKAPPIDHDHETGFIRGILSQKVNWLERQWELDSYGHLSKPKELTEYQQDPPAFQCIGRVIYK